MQFPSLVAAVGVVTALALTPIATNAGSTSNLAREKNWADQIVDYLVSGEAVWLSADQVKFLALYNKPSNKSAKAGVILLHGRGVHPAWGFIDTLRIDLADSGWHTLSLQLPILDPDIKLSEYGKTFPEAFRRINAGIQYLKQKGVNDIHLVGHSSGAMTAVAYVAEHPRANVNRIVAIGLTTEASGNKYMHPVTMLESVRKPVFDVYGSDDLPIVIDTAPARREAARKANNTGYIQVRENGANHFFTDHYDRLKSQIVAWLKKSASR